MPRSSNRKKQRPRVKCPNCDGNGSPRALQVGAEPVACAFCGGSGKITQELHTAWMLTCREMSAAETILFIYQSAPNLLSARARVIIWQRLNAQITAWRD